MNPTALTLILISLAQEAPELVAKILAALHKQGKITAEEVTAFLVELQAASGASFFPTLKAPA